MGSGTKPIHAVEKTFEIISELDDLGSAGTSELARDLDLSKSTTYTHLNTLEKIGFVVKEEKTYRLSCRFLRIGSNVQHRNELYRRGKDEVQALAEKTDERANLVIEESGMGTCVFSTGSTESMQTHMELGEKYHMHATGTGKAILAHMSESRVNAIVDEHGLPEYTDNTISTHEQLEKELAKIRDQGISYDDEETIPGLRCIAAPILDHGEPLGSVSVSGPLKGFTIEKRERELADTVREVANVIKLNFTFD